MQSPPASSPAAPTSASTPAIPAAPPPSPAARARRWLATCTPGLALAVALALAAAVGQSVEEGVIGHAVVEALVLAILLGVAVRNLIRLPRRTAPGIGFAAKQVLELAVVLLGASVDVRAVLQAGPALLVGIVVVVACAITASTLVGRLLGLNPKLAVLVAVGNSICGNSAIAAVAPVIEAAPADVASAIALTAVLGVALVLLLPAIIPLLGLTLYQYGVVAGLSVYAVPQVLAATLPVSALSARVGTLVKLVRVLLLGPVVLFFSLRRGNGAAAGMARRSFSLTRYVPWFILGFLGLAALRSLGALPTALADPLRTLSTWLTVVAMAALGLGVDVRAVRRAGPRVSAAIIVSLLVLLTLSLTLLTVLHIGTH